MKKFLLAFFSILLFSGNSSAAILCQSLSGGAPITVTTLATAAVSPSCKNTSVVITSALSAVQSNISSATVPGGRWPTDRTLEVRKGGSINPTTKFTGLQYAVPEWFGANTTPGTTDMQAAIQKAVNAASVVKFLPTTYLVSVGVEIPANKTIQGAGKYLTVIKLADSSAETNQATAGNGGVFKAFTASNITIKDLTVDGNRTNQASLYRAHNIYFHKGSHNTVKNVYSKSSSHESITFWGSTHGTVEDCHTYDNINSGISTALATDYTLGTAPDYAAQSEYFTAIGNYSENDGNGNAAAKSFATGLSINSRFSTITNNKIYRAGLAGIAIGHITAGSVPNQDASYSTFADNIIIEGGYLSEASGGTGWGAGIIGAYAVNGVVIDSNVIKDCFGHGIAMILADETMNETVISNNNISGCSRSGVSMAGHHNVSVTGNSIYGCGIGTTHGTPTATADEAGVVVNGVATLNLHTNIEGNTIRNMQAGGTTPNGIYVARSRHVSILDNKIIDDQGAAPTMANGIKISSLAAFTNVSRNTLLANYASESIATSGNTVTLDATAKTITRTTGDWTTSFNTGQSLSVTGFLTLANNCIYVISNVTATVLTYSSANNTPVDETATTPTLNFYGAKHSVAAPYISDAGTSTSFQLNRLSLQPIVQAFTLTAGATSHIYSNANLLASGRTPIRWYPTTSNAAASATNLYLSATAAGSVTFTSSAAAASNQMLISLQ